MRPCERKSFKGRSQRSTMSSALRPPSWVSIVVLSSLFAPHYVALTTGAWSHHSSSRGPSISMVARSGLSSLSVELGLRKRGKRYIIGSDEVGRGCIAGPVLAASCCIMTDDLSTYRPIEGVDDSKRLSAEERDRIFRVISSEPETYSWHVAQRSSVEIDEANILLATMECFKDAVEGLVRKERLPVDTTYGIVDGHKSPKLTGPYAISCRPYIRGDANVYTVALASIIAKVTRDKFMTDEAHTLYPNYEFDRNKGYSTREHVLAIHKYGACPIHRMSFKPVRGR